MSKENNLTDFLTDVADSLKESNRLLSDMRTINAQDFSDYIKNGYLLETKVINDTTNYDGYAMFLKFDRLPRNPNGLRKSLSHITVGGDFNILLFLTQEKGALSFEGTALLLSNDYLVMEVTDAVGSMTDLDSGNSSELYIGFKNMEFPSFVNNNSKTPVTIQILRTF